MNPHTNGPNTISDAAVMARAMGGTPNIVNPAMSSTKVMPRRTTDCETVLAIREPRNVPGVPPIISGSRTHQSTPVTTMCPMAAASASGTACTRSVPTSLAAARVGYMISIATMISDPEPTEVIPTNRPPTAPTISVGTGRMTGLFVVGPGCAPLRGSPRYIRNAYVSAATTSVTPIATFRNWSWASVVPTAPIMKAPMNAVGTEPAINSPASFILGDPRRQWVSAPTVLLIDAA